MKDDTPPRKSTGLSAGLRWNRARDMPHVTPANNDAPYHERLNGHPGAPPIRESYPLPVLDPDVAVELRRATMEDVS